MNLNHVKEFNEELLNAGITPKKLSPQILPKYARKDM